MGPVPVPAQAEVVIRQFDALRTSTQMTTDRVLLKHGVWLTPLKNGTYWIAIDSPAVSLEGISLDRGAPKTNAHGTRMTVFIPIDDPSRVYVFGVTGGKMGYMYA